MDSQTLSQLLDRVIADVLAQRRGVEHDARQKVRVVITGEDASTLPATLLSLLALDRAGYRLLVSFSHSASLSGLRAACMRDVEARCRGALFNESGPQAGDEDYASLYLPALSTNSLSKIALGIVDNLAGRWAFHALGQQKKVIATLNPQCLQTADAGFAPALLARLAGYASTLERYGIVIAGKKPAVSPADGNKRLITLADIRLHPAAEALQIDSHTLITPAAQDEIRQQNITVIKG